MNQRDLNQMDDGIAELIAEKIEKLRPRLLDLSRRNPLISTPLDSRRGSYVRVVDEVPEYLFKRLSNGEQLRFEALPDFEDEPTDEQTEHFREELNLAMADDEEYAAAVEQIDPGDTDAPEKELAAERQLRDRLRARLGLPDRGTHDNPRLHDHAISHGIAPRYDLLTTEEEHEDGRHNDDVIQTLLLPEVMERTLNRIRTKCRTFQQETGLNVMQAAFGYLEWTDPESKQQSFSPLILVPIDLARANSPRGTRFIITGTGDEASLNTVLDEKLRREFGAQLPSYYGGSVEQYLRMLETDLPRRLNARVRRYVTFGAFPSAELAMYHDLDTTGRDFAASDVVRRILAGSDEAAGFNLFAEEYDTDVPEVEERVPMLVTEADSSQFSALVDIASGKSLAVEGPPGTGKSQTIVNAIAAAMLQGKKVLFVAEKTAALEVVKARLDHLGLGEFVLPLTAHGSSRQQVITAVAERLEMTVDQRPSDRDTELSEFRRVRQRLATYINLMAAEIPGTGHTTYDVLGRALLLEDQLLGLDIPEVDAQSAAGYDRARITEILSAAEQLAEARTQALAKPSGWQGVQKSPLDRFTTDEALRLASEASRLCFQAAQLRDTLFDHGALDEASADDVRWLGETLTKLSGWAELVDIDVAVWLARQDESASLRALVERCGSARALRAQLSAELTGPFDRQLGQLLRDVHEVCESTGLSTFTQRDIQEQRELMATGITNGENAIRLLDLLCGQVPELADCPLSTVSVAASLVRKTPRTSLLLRSSSMTDSRTTQTLSQGVQQLRRLQSERDELDVLFDLAKPADVSQLFADAEYLATAGPLSILSGRFRGAKRRWQSLLREARPFSKVAAAAGLNRLATWKRDAAQFDQNVRLRELLGSDFAGVNTDLGNLDGLTSYLQEVETRFSALELRPLRKMLQTAESDVLATLTELQVDGFECTYRNLPSNLDQRRDQLRTWDAGFSRVAELLPELKHPETTPPQRLPELAATLDTYVQAIESIVTDRLRQPLGEYWRGIDLELSHVEKELEFAELIGERPEWVNFYCGVADARRLAEFRDMVLGDAAPAAESTADSLMALVRLPEESACRDESYSVRGNRYAGMVADRSGLVQFSQVHAYVEKIRNFGFGVELDAVDASGRDIAQLPDIVEARIFRALARLIHVRYGEELTEFRHEGLDNLRQQLAVLDRRIIAESSRVARQSLHRIANPPTGIGTGRKSDFTEFALLNHEVSKSKRHIPVRELTRRAGAALLELKPCWMMSPLAVAQYLDGPSVHFDLCVIDEASQMTPEHAIGALSRSSQAMVVGDTNQLPPSNFFRKMVVDDDEDNDEEVVEESILELANGAFRPSRRLRWHYRSRHSGLIAFSNRTVYDDDLIVFPSASEDLSDMGVSLFEVDGHYKSGTNPGEAEVMAQEAVRFMREHPDRSLGVVTLNQKQRDLVDEKIDHALNRDHQAREYVHKWEGQRDGLESFFVKNLENVQGDERDVIFIGTVYGKNPDTGRVYQRFGPINGVAGKRRLNVLFSRAKKQIVTFSSMTAADITAHAEGNPGAYMLKRWLEYSKTGRLEVGEITSREPESDFERHVAQLVRSMGCEAIPQVGAGGFYIDIGVKHPDWPHGYLLGVECDGATYHSAKSARDRDRLRQEVLEGLGWHLHRVWSTNWFNDPASEANKLRRSIELRLAEIRS